MAGKRQANITWLSVALNAQRKELDLPEVELLGHQLEHILLEHNSAAVSRLYFACTAAPLSVVMLLLLLWLLWLVTLLEPHRRCSVNVP